MRFKKIYSERQLFQLFTCYLFCLFFSTGPWETITLKSILTHAEPIALPVDDLKQSPAAAAEE
jgi:uncharacterized membrane protein